MGIPGWAAQVWSLSFHSGRRLPEAVSCEFGRRISPSWAMSKTSRQGSILGLIPRLSCPSAPVQTPLGSCSEPWVLLAVQYDSPTAVEVARPGWCGQEGSPP